MIPVPGVERRRNIGMVVGERSLGKLELPKQDGAGLAQLADDGRIDVRDEGAVQRHSCRRGNSFGPAQVLDRDRHAVELRQELAPPDHLLGGARLRQRQLRRDERIRLQGRIDTLDPAQHRLGQLNGRDLARRDKTRQLVDLEVVEVVEGHVPFLPRSDFDAAIRGAPYVPDGCATTWRVRSTRVEIAARWRWYRALAGGLARAMFRS